MLMVPVLPQHLTLSCGLAGPCHRLCLLAAQELKSEQPELPARVAEALLAAGWVHSLDIAGVLRERDAGSIKTGRMKDTLRSHAPQHGEAASDRRCAKSQPGHNTLSRTALPAVKVNIHVLRCEAVYQQNP